MTSGLSLSLCANNEACPVGVDKLERTLQAKGLKGGVSNRRSSSGVQVIITTSADIRESCELNASLAELRKAVKTHGFEDIVAKRLHSWYEPGQRSGAWRKMRINQGQEFVIGGYTPASGTLTP
jgi:hypothetical protein